MGRSRCAGVPSACSKLITSFAAPTATCTCRNSARHCPCCRASHADHSRIPPPAIAMTPDGKTAYVPNNGTDRVTLGAARLHSSAPRTAHRSIHNVQPYWGAHVTTASAAAPGQDGTRTRIRYQQRQSANVRYGAAQEATQPNITKPDIAGTLGLMVRRKVLTAGSGVRARWAG